jgi:2-hydroxy-3-keto-5-methylthiopentenyl-1-phosphate phosphatase
MVEVIKSNVEKKHKLDVDAIMKGNAHFTPKDIMNYITQPYNKEATTHEENYLGLQKAYKDQLSNILKQQNIAEEEKLNVLESDIAKTLAMSLQEFHEQAYTKKHSAANEEQEYEM